MVSTSTQSIQLPLLLLLFFTIPTKSTDTITAARPLKDDGSTLVSSGGNFELGFFAPGDSGRRFVGIWYKKISLRTAVWVANRDAPIIGSSGAVLQIGDDPPRLALFNGTGEAIWSTNSSKTSRRAAVVAQLMDTGNLVVREEAGGEVVWESFDYPCDIQLPGMKLGRELQTGFERLLTSWKSSDDPSPGSYTYRIDPRGYPQPVLMKGSVEQYRNGPWNGLRFSGNPSLKSNSIFTFNFVMNDKEIYYVYELLNQSVISHRLLNPYGTMQRVVWSDRAQGWLMYLTAQSDNCDSYALCGKFGNCNIANSPDCACLRGFEPRSPRHWEAGDWSDGCVRKTPLNCKGDGFLKYTNVKLPDTQYSWYNTSLTLDQCRQKCLLNCSCMAYANLDIRDGGSGCLIWIDILIDLKVYADNGQDVYVRMAASELGKGTKRIGIGVGCTLSAVFLLGASAALYMWKRVKQKARAAKGRKTEETQEELPLFDFNLIAQATNNFSDDNKIGEGGFGPVYKGTLEEGQEIAVKRLSKDSRQGLDEFKNEVMCIARLQHRNLVKLLGCCIEADERILLYEYLPKKSLDFFIFDETRSNLLDWPTRFQIIKGIARGVLYLHQDSRLRIVHRDLKAGNILLDNEMNPKISDFGMARIFDGSEYEAKTRRVVGTYGYMSPEYAIDGRFSVKSDVFSFGVLVLEIVSGKRNRGFNHPDHYHNLVGHAWKAFKQGGSMELDPLLDHSYIDSQVLRSIQIGLLCVQQNPEDRPGMSSVMVMLDSDCELPCPKEPGFFIARSIVNMDSMSSYFVESTTCSNNELTTTVVSGR